MSPKSVNGFFKTRVKLLFMASTALKSLKIIRGTASMLRNVMLNVAIKPNKGIPVDSKMEDIPIFKVEIMKVAIKISLK